MPTIQHHPWYHRRHHRDGGFANIWEEPPEPSFWQAASWLVRHGLQRKDQHPPEAVTTDGATLRRPPDRLRVTWIGHATLLIQTPGRTLLTDPMFGHRASPLPFAGPDRKAPLPLDVGDLPPIDTVLVSHDHYDHLDRGSVEALVERDAPRFVVPLGVDTLLRRWGAENVLALDWWQFIRLDGATLHAVPARHFSGRGLTNRNGTLWCGWYLELPEADVRLYYVGDTAYAPLFTAVRERLGAPDVTCMPIGAYAPRWFMQGIHVTPEEALQAAQDLGTRHVLPIHWGTFDLADEPIDEPIRRARRHAATLGLTDALHPLPIGGSFVLAAD